VAERDQDGVFGRPVLSQEARRKSAASKPAVPDSQGGTSGDPVELCESFRPRKPLFTLAQVILPEATREEVHELFAVVEHREALYEEWGLKRIDPSGRRSAVNFYGPPGTGKTLCADALASHFGKTIIDVNYAEIESKYVGETPKNIVAAFEEARKTDSVIFFDEADSILGRRMTQVTQAADQAVNVSRAVMMKQLDSFEGLVIFATNLAKNFDGAFVRRIPYHIELPAPDESGRADLWALLIPNEVVGKSELDCAVLARESHGLTGGDIRNVILRAASKAIMRIGPERKMKLDDLLGVITRIRKSKQDVGSGP
jgi:SpoVK/Ycf46/Vps4 family AAA+-type ATPase